MQGIMPRGQKSKLNARRRRCRARNNAQASEGAQEAVEAAEKSNPESCGSSEMSEKQSVSSITSDILVLELSDESSTDDLDDEEIVFENYHSVILLEDVLEKRVFMLLQILLDNYRMRQLTTLEDMMQVIDKHEIKKFPEILKKTAEKLADVFAVELREVESSRKVYDLISKLKLPNNGRVRAGQGFPKTGFLMIVLGMISMNGNSAREEDIWRRLRSISVYPGKKHQIYGEPRKLMTQYLVKLKYLEYRQVADSDPPCYELLWGPQAHAETNKEAVLKFVEKINKITPYYFPGLCAEEKEKNKSNHEDSPDTPAKACTFSMLIWPRFYPLPKCGDILFARKKI
ncbi:hypothetical protein A6R68_15139 [Neotoma lepida]|uniref:MAGE domain-containing protein n=1 Tax=Neotoma lepida TaxID=56216 RepID=A0A1A6H8Z2_NEOLE|nr:hypothetical protein A6R68_15139 [Neotoma lepida]